ncbi:hypothetical protein JTB14_014796 [Gonioctena quinquepunctata]|nr:hypothetical protein JTB14_014796 [Gonioctena quinquepunctata]
MLLPTEPHVAQDTEESDDGENVEAIPLQDLNGLKNSRTGMEINGLQFYSWINQDLDLIQIIIVWRRPGNAERLRHVQEVHTYRGGTLMEWGGITIGGRTYLVFPHGFLGAQQYLDYILQSIVRPLAGANRGNFHLMHDNARPHVAHVVTDWLNNEGIELLPWPA